MSSRGVAAGFIKRALDTPYDSIEVPDSRSLMDNGLTTGLLDSAFVAESARP